jgi:glycosyltransferase involved in cell wall biosynthesis
MPPSFPPKVSICTPTKNRQLVLPLLAECIKNQSYPKHLIEWVVIDDSETPVELLLNSINPGVNIKYHYSDKPLSIGRKRNISCQMSSGDIIINFDDDDFYPVDRISHAVETLQETTSYVAGCSIVPVLFVRERSLWITGPFGENHAIANTFAFKKELLELTKYNDLDFFG